MNQGFVAPEQDVALKPRPVAPAVSGARRFGFVAPEQDTRVEQEAPAPQESSLLDRLGQSVRATAGTAKQGLDRLASGLARGVALGADAVGFDSLADSARADARAIDADVPEWAKGARTWEQVKADPLGNIVPFVAEQGIGGIPDMAAAATSLPFYAFLRANTLGQQRADNNQTGDATLGDVITAAPAAVASGLLERLGTGGIVNEFAGSALRSAGRAGVKEAATEGGQSLVEYAGSNLGTKAGFDPYEAADQALAGIVVGGPFGAAANYGVRQFRGQPEPAAPELIDATLDGGPAQAANIMEMLRSGAVTPEQAASMTPEFAARAAERFTARAQPQPELPPIIAAPEGNVRSDDTGGILGLLKQRAIEDEIMARAKSAKGDNPTIAAILDSRANQRQQLASIWERLARIEANGKREPLPEIDLSSVSIPDGPARRIPDTSEVAIPGRTFDRMLQAESGGRQKDAQGRTIRSNKGAVGIAQVMPATGPEAARLAGLEWDPARFENDANYNRALGQAYHREQLRAFGGDERKAVAAYNAGPGAVRRAIKKARSDGGSWEDHIPQETKDYLGKVMSGDERTAPTDERAPYRVGDEAELRRRRNEETGGDLDLQDQPYRGFENTAAPESPTLAQLENGDIYQQPDGRFGPRSRGNQRTYEPPMQTGGSDKAFRDTRDDPADQPGYWEDRARMQAEELRRAWEERMQEEAHQANDRRAQDGQQRAASGDPADRYREYDQKPHKDGDYFRFNDEGFVAGVKGHPVAFRNAKEAARWAAAHQMGGDVEPVVWATNSTRIALRRRNGSTYGQAQEAADTTPPADEAARNDGFRRDNFERWQPPAGRSRDSSQRVIGDGEAAPGAPGGDGGSSPPGAPPTPPPSGPPLAPSAPFRGNTSQPAVETETNVRPREQVVTASGTQLDTEFDVIEARDLITSDQPNFDRRFQPRDRGTRSSSDAQIAEIASRLDPEQLRSSRLASQGAPIIGPDRMVESGNGRTAAIRRAYEMHPERAADYRKMIEAKGFDTSGMKEPVLVRRRLTDLDDDARAAFTRDAQSGGTMRMSPSELAKADAAATNDDVLSLYRGGDINSAGNREFAKSFIKRAIGPDERNSMQMPDGSLSGPDIQRIRSAMLAKAYDNPTLIEKIVSDPETEIKAIGNVLTDLAPSFAQIKAKVARGDLPREFDITPQIAEIAGIIAQARRDGRLVTEFLEQDDIFSGRTDPITEALANIMLKGEGLTRPRSAKDVADGLNFYVRDAQEVGPSLLGDDMSERALQIAQAAAEKLKARDRAADDQSSLFGKRAARIDSGKRANPFKRLKDELAAINGTDVQREMADVLSGLLDDSDVVAYGRKLLDNPAMSRGESEIETGRAFVREKGDTETLLHEAVHLAVMSRYGWEFDHLQPGDAATTPARQLLHLFNEARQAVIDGKRGESMDQGVRAALNSVDEFLAYGLTNPAFQRWLHGGTMWDRFVDVVRRILGMEPRVRSMLSDVIQVGGDLIDAARTDPRRVGNGVTPKRMQQRSNSLIDRIIDREGIAGDAASLKRAVGNPQSTLKSALRGMDRAASALFYSNDARLRGLAARHNSDAIADVANLFHVEAGKGDGKGRTYHEAVSIHATRNVQQMFEALEPLAQSKDSLRRVQDLLRFPDRRQRASKAELEAAQKVRDLLKAEIDYRKAAGEDIGEVRDGYFPRILDIQKVVKRRDEFLARAEKLYRKHGASDPAAAAEAWFERVFDSYSGIEGGLDHFGASTAGGGIGGKTAKGREFSKDADEVLADFYGEDTMAALSAYFHGSARRAEYTRRFGVKGADGSKEREAWVAEHGDKTQLQVYEDRIKADLRNSKEDAEGALGVVNKVIASNLGRLGADVGVRSRNVVSYLHAWNQLQKLDRTTVTSLTELASGFIRGGPRYGLPFVRDSLSEFARALRGADSSDAKRWSEALGVSQDAMVSQMMMSRAGADGQETPGIQRTMAGFYRATLLHQFTEGTRVASIRMGQKYLDVLAGDIQSPVAKTAKRAEFLLRELGVSDPAAFGKAVSDGKMNIDLVRKGVDPMANEYATALVRFANQTIMVPSRATKPTLANHPVGSLFYSLLSWSYGFKKNVLDRAGRLTIKGIRERDPRLLAPALGLALAAAWADIVDSKVRPAIFGSSYDFANETTGEHFLRVADRSGLTGALSPVLNAYKGVRYNRSIAESLSGPAIGTLAGAADTVIKAAGAKNSPNTNTAERNAARAIYQVTIEPAMDAAFASRAKGIFSTVGVLGTGNKEGGILPADEDAFVDAVAGGKVE